MTGSLNRAAVVGGAGFIGRSLVKFLKGRGLEVQVTQKGDAPDALEADLVVWAAGYTSDYAERPLATIEAHASALAHIVERGSYQVLVYLSSTRLYDGLDGVVDEDTPIALDSAHPRHLFDLSKGLGEWFVRHRGGPRAHVLRLSGVYGDGLDGGSFLEGLVTRVLDRADGPVQAAPNTARDYVHVDDVCEATWAVVERGYEPLYVVGSGELVDNAQLCELLRERTGVCLEPALAVSEQPPPPRLDPKRLLELGVSPRALSEGLDRVLTWQDNQRAMRSMMGVTHMPWM